MDTRSHNLHDAILAQFASAFIALAGDLGIAASAEPDEHYGVRCRAGRAGGVLVQADDLDSTRPGWAHQAAATHLSCILREAIREAVEKRAA